MCNQGNIKKCNIYITQNVRKLSIWDIRNFKKKEKKKMQAKLILLLNSH